MKKTVNLALVATLLAVTSASQAGIVADLVAHHEAAKAARLAASGSAVAPAPAAAGSAAVIAKLAGLGIPGAGPAAAMALKTHSASVGVVNRQLSNSKDCAEAVRTGAMKFSTFSQYMCILTGVPAHAKETAAANSALAAAVAPTPTTSKH